MIAKPVRALDGRVVGVNLALPDLNEMLRGNRSGRLFPAVLKLLWRTRRRKYKRIRLLMLGVVPEFRGKGVDAVIVKQLWNYTTPNGVDWCEASWMLEDNPAVSNFTERLGFERNKVYRIYDRAL